MVGLKQLSLGSGNNLIVIVSGTHVNNSSSSRERDGLSEGNNSDVHTMDNYQVRGKVLVCGYISVLYDLTRVALRRKCVLKDAWFEAWPAGSGGCWVKRRMGTW